MNQQLHRSLRRTMTSLCSMLLVMLVLSGCGFGDDESEDQPEPTAAAELSTPAAPTATDEAEQLSPEPDLSPTEAETDATPDQDAGSPTPAIVVSAPPVTVPTVPPTEPATPAPADGEASPVPADETVGDGTGGAGIDIDEVALTPEDATPAAEADGELTVVASCDVESFPPFEGAESTQTTTTDVNFRAGPGTDCDAIGTPLAAGVDVEVLSEPVVREGEEDLQWVSVSVDGTEGWLVTEFLEPVAGE